MWRVCVLVVVVMATRTVVVWFNIHVVATVNRRGDVVKRLELGTIASCFKSRDPAAPCFLPQNIEHSAVLVERDDIALDTERAAWGHRTAMPACRNSVPRFVVHGCA